MVIVEGPDGAGKTTLVRRLSRELGIEPEPKVVNERAEAMTDLVAWVHKDLNQGFGRRLYDRHRLISEPIYGPLVRGHLEPGFDDLDWLALMLARFYEHCPVIIYCLPPFETVWGNVRDDPANVVVRSLSTLKLIHASYHMRCALDLARTPEEATVMTWNYVEDEDTGKLEGLAQLCRRRFSRAGLHA